MAANVLHFQIPLEIPFDSMLLLVWFYFTTFTLQYRKDTVIHVLGIIT